MSAGTRRLDITYHISTAEADQQAEAFNQRQLGREKRLLTDAEAAEKAKGKLVEKTNREKIAAAMKAQEAEQNASREAVRGAELTAQAHKQANATIGEGTLAVGKFAAGMAAIQGVVPVLSAVSGHFAKIRSDAAKAAADVQQMRGSVRELQALKGQLGETGPGVAHTFQIARQTLQATGDVQAMESAALGTGELAIGRTISKAELQKGLVGIGRMQVLEGGSADAYGRLAGQIALQADHKMTGDELEARAFRLFQIQQPGGFANFSSAVGQFSKLNPLVQNKVMTGEEAMGLLSAMSVSSPEEAATLSNQFVRATMAGRLRARGMQVSGDVDFEKTSEYLRGIGAGKDTNPLAIGKKIADDLASQEATARKAGHGFSAHDYLLTHGFANQEERLAIMAFSGLKNSGNLEAIEKAQNAKLETGAISRRFNERLGRDLFLKGRQAELADQAATMKAGAAEEPLLVARRAAFARLKAQGKISGSFEEWQGVEASTLQRGAQDLFFGEWGSGGYHGQVDKEVSRVLSAERKRLGLQQYGTFQWSAHGTLSRSAREVQAAGGDITKGTAESLARSAANLEKATAELHAAAAEQKRAAERNPVPPALPARPPNQAVRVP